MTNPIEATVNAAKGKGFLGMALKLGKGTVKLGYEGATSNFIAPQMLMGSIAGGIWGFSRSDSSSLSGKMRSGAEGAIIGSAAGGLAGAAKLQTKIMSMKRGHAFNVAKKQIKGEIPRLAEEGTLSTIELGARSWLRGVGAPTADYLLAKTDSLVTAGLFTGKAAKSLGKNILENPVAAAGIGLAGYGTYRGISAYNSGASLNNSPTLGGQNIDAHYDRQAEAELAMQTGISPMGRVGSAASIANDTRARMQASTVGLVQGLHRGRH